MKELFITVTLGLLPTYAGAQQSAQPVVSFRSTSSTVNDVHAVGMNVYAATAEGVSISVDGGNTFQNRSAESGLPKGWIRRVSATDRTIFALPGSGYFVSTDGGNSFQEKHIELAIDGADIVNDLISDDSGLYAATYGGLFRSLDGGASWTTLLSDDSRVNRTVYSVIVKGPLIIASQRKGVSVSNDEGQSFKFKELGLAVSQGSQLALSGENLYVLGDYGLFISKDGGASFVENESLSVIGGMTGIAAYGNTVHVSGLGDGLQTSYDGGQTWNMTLPYERLNSVYSDGSKVYAAGERSGTSEGGVFISSDQGRSWTLKDKKSGLGGDGSYSN